MGLTGPQGPAGPGPEGYINSVTASITLSTSAAAPTTVTTLNLPAGSYLFFGKVAILRTGGSGSSACTLNSGATVLDTLANQASTSGELSVLNGAVTLAATTTVTVRCNTTAGTTMSANNRVLSAYKISTLTVQ